MKKGISMLLAIVMMMALIVVPVGAASEITVVLNGEMLEFDVPPALINDRTMVPMRAIFEALEAKVAWNDQNEAVTGVSRTGTRVVVAIGSNIAMVDDQPIEIDQPPVLINDRTLVPLRFISEAFSCRVDWDDPTQTVTITSNSTDAVDVKSNTVYIGAQNFLERGCWQQESSTVLKGKSDTSGQSGKEITTDDAVAQFEVFGKGKYKVWANSKDYATNQPGTRFFHVALDGKRIDHKLGAHGKEGFLWEMIGEFDLEPGIHSVALQDTSGFFARCQGIIISCDPDYKPSADYEEYSKYIRDNRFEGVIPANYPAWAKQSMSNEESISIENDKIKLTFYRSIVDRGYLVQNEVHIKKNGQWQLVKEKSEDLGVLAMRADESVFSTKRPPVSSLADLPKENFTQRYTGAFGPIQTIDEESFYRTGVPEWLIPSSMTKVDENTIVLGCASQNVDATLTFSLDDLVAEPKVQMNATFKNDGAYSFAFFTGDGVADGSFQRVTAPLTYTKNFVPKDDIVLSEYMMFTPMCTFTFGEGSSAVTKGIVVDPTCVRQDVATPGYSDFGVMFRTPTGQARGHIIAPLFGTQKCNFGSGDTYSFAYRMVYNGLDWFENYKHVAQDMYNCHDIRTNHYASLNDAIYNATDLIMDDLYGGWDDKDMAFYNMEASRVTTISNAMEMMQRYMLTDDKAILEERAIPIVAFMLSRGGSHFKRVEGNNSYTPKTPVAIKATPTGYPAATLIGLYQMSQGRTPFLLNYGVQSMSSSNLAGVAANQTMLDMTKDEKYIEDLKKSADNYITSMLESTKFKTQPFVGGFIYSDSVPMLNTFVTAYEKTGEQKYLDAAEKVGRQIMTDLWTTGYQNDYATTDYTVDPVKTAERPLANDSASWYYHKDGVQWRIGNPFGVNTKASEAENKLKEESAPGWVPARTGMSTEHLMTPSNGNAITMNMWAGTMLRLAKYSGEEYFETMARNAMIGRFGNYGGYYWERYLLHDKQEDYPYVGPDYDLIYWHHIPVFLGLLEDFLIHNIWIKSDANIEFPSTINASYAYFVTNQYGYAPGKFYDENDMWLWLDRGIIEPDTDEVDYITAKKEGVLGLALVNEGNNAITTTVTLGEKIPNAAAYTETATLYDKNGNKSTVEIANGKFTVTIPAKGIQSVILHPDVHVPSFAKVYTPSVTLGKTMATHNAGKAYLLQFNDEEYYAYVLTTKTADEISSATIHYTVDGKSYSETINEYPFEKIIKVNAKNDFTYTMTVKTTDGKTEDLGGGTLSPIRDAEKEPYKFGAFEKAPIVSNLPKFNSFAVKIKGLGSGNNLIRCVVPSDRFPFEKITADYLTGAKVKAKLVYKETGAEKILESVVTGNEVRENGDLVLLIEGTGDVPSTDLSASTYQTGDIWIMAPDADFKSVDVGIVSPATKPEEKKPEASAPTASVGKFDAFTVKLTGIGVGEKEVRCVVSAKALPFQNITPNSLTGLKAKAMFVRKADGQNCLLESVIIGNEVRDNGTIVLQIAPTEIVPLKGGIDSKIYSFSDISILPADADFGSIDLGKSTVPVTPAPTIPTPTPKADLTGFTSCDVKVSFVGSNATHFRVVVPVEGFPFMVTENALAGLKVSATFTRTTDNQTMTLESVIKANEMRGAQTVLVIEPTAAIPLFDIAKESKWTTITVKK